MRKRKSLRPIFPSVLILGMILGGGAFPTFNLQTPRPSHNFAYVFLEDAISRAFEAKKTWEKYGPLVSVQFATINDPLIQYDALNTQKTIIVDRLSTLSLGAAKFVTEDLILAADMGLNSVRLADGSGSTLAFGDLRFLGKYSLLAGEGYGAWSLVGEAMLPSGSRTYFVSNSSIGLGAKLAWEYEFGPLRLAVNAGVTYFPEGAYRNIDSRFEIPLAIGAHIPIGMNWAMNVEGATTWLPKAVMWGMNDFYVGARYHIFEKGQLFVGGSIGNIAQDGSFTWRVLAGLKVVPWAEKIVEVRNPVFRDCGVKSKSMQFPMRRLEPAEIEKIRAMLPLVSSKRNPLPVLGLGDMTGLSGGIPFVEKSQVVFGVDLVDFPARDTVTSLDSVVFHLNLIMAAKESDTDAEMFCLLDEKICSGEVYRDRDWVGNINRNFFKGKETPNDYFLRKSTGKTVGMRKDIKLVASEPALDLVRLIENAERVTPLDVLYAGHLPNKIIKKKTLYLSVADDVHVSKDSYLSITLRENTCESMKRLEDPTHNDKNGN